MGHLAFVGSHRVNGVSALHTELMRETVFADLHRLYPDRIVNKTNGITFRRWLHQANPRLTRLLREACGGAVLDDPAALPRLAEHADDPALVERLAAVKRANKMALSRFVHEQTGRAARPGRAVRRADQAHPRIQAAAAEPARHGRALPGDPRRSGRRLGAAGQDFRRQGGGRAMPRPS